MEFNFDFLSPAESYGRYFDSYFESSPSRSTGTTAASRHSPRSSLGSTFGSVSTSTSWLCVGGPGAGAGAGAGIGAPAAGGAVPRSSDATMTEGYVKPPDRIHHWLDALQATISSALDKGQHPGFLTGGEDVKTAPVSDLVSCIIYHHLCRGLDPAPAPGAHSCHSVTTTDDILH